MKNSDWSFNNSDSDYMRIFIKNFEVEARVGLHPWEQHPERPTRLIVNVDMFAALTTNTNHSTSQIVDYDLVCNILKKWPQRQHTPLLETLAEEVLQQVLKNPNVEACRVSIEKPDIFNQADSAGIELYRRRTT